MGQCFSGGAQHVAQGAGAPVSIPQHHSGAAGGLSAWYSSLPSGAEKVIVRNVYDGDTLTLVDERRVRFLGIDTPEIKEKQPFAEEAKAYVKDLCNKQEIWISYEPGHEKQDHYGRLLCFIWVKKQQGSNNNQYLCVNEGILHAGLANVYMPNKNSKLHNWDKLLALQNEARLAKKGLWSTFKDFTVYKTVNGAAYHKKDCRHLSKSRNLTQLKASEASAQGLHPCRTCLAD